MANNWIMLFRGLFSDGACCGPPIAAPLPTHHPYLRFIVRPGHHEKGVLCVLRSAELRRKEYAQMRTRPDKFKLEGVRPAKHCQTMKGSPTRRLSIMSSPSIIFAGCCYKPYPSALHLAECKPPDFGGCVPPRSRPSYFDQILPARIPAEKPERGLGGRFRCADIRWEHNQVGQHGTGQECRSVLPGGVPSLSVRLERGNVSFPPALLFPIFARSVGLISRNRLPRKVAKMPGR